MNCNTRYRERNEMRSNATIYRGTNLSSGYLPEVFSMMYFGTTLPYLIGIHFRAGVWSGLAGVVD